MGKNDKQKPKMPFVSICTPTYNRRPFIPHIIKCFQNQKYPKSRMEWIIIDDGTDKVEDLFVNVPQVKYFRYEEKLTLGKKRNLAHEKCKGSIIVYMDDDDYYPPERVIHAVETLKANPNALCAGSSEMHIYFKHIQKMYQFGPYGPNHSTAATFAFRKELLDQTSFDDTACVAEERKFLKEYNVPFVQLDVTKSILVFSHSHNSFDKKELLAQPPTPFVNPSPKCVDDFVKEPDLKKFFMEDIDELLTNYEPGKPENKPDVIKQLAEIKISREKMMEEQMKIMSMQNEAAIRNQMAQNPVINNLVYSYESKIQQMTTIMQELTMENNLLKDKVKYMDEKIKEIIKEQLKRQGSCSNGV